MKYILTFFLAFVMTTSPSIKKEPGCSSSPDGKKKLVPPEVQLLLDFEYQNFNWPGWTGLPSRPGWVRYRFCRAGVTECLEQQPLLTKLKAVILSSPLGLLWDYLDRAGKTWLLTDILIKVCRLCLLTIARSLWRKVRRPEEQGAGQIDLASIETDCLGKDEIKYYNRLRQLEAKIALMEEYQTTLEEFNCQQRIPTDITKDRAQPCFNKDAATAGDAAQQYAVL